MKIPTGSTHVWEHLVRRRSRTFNRPIEWPYGSMKVSKKNSPRDDPRERRRERGRWKSGIRIHSGIRVSPVYGPTLNEVSQFSWKTLPVTVPPHLPYMVMLWGVRLNEGAPQRTPLPARNPLHPGPELVHKGLGLMHPFVIL